MKTLSVFVLLLLPVKMLYSSPGEDTLKYCLSKSDSVVAGTVQGIICVTADSTSCSFDLHVDESFKGRIATGSTIKVFTTEFWGDFRLPCWEKGARCIVFVNPLPSSRAWGLADPWFGVQSHSQFLSTSLRELR